MRVYWDAGLKQLARAMGFKGEALTSLEKCGNFRKTHNFILSAYQVITMSLDACSATYSDAQCKYDEVWEFWSAFASRDCIVYIALWVAIRSRNWQLRIAALKMAAPLFHALDRTFYLRLVPRHLSHMGALPQEIQQHFQNGGFAVGLSKTSFNTVGIDEAHEMCINRNLKKALVTPDADYFDRQVHYLPQRAHMMSNLSAQLFPTVNPSKEKSTSEATSGTTPSEAVFKGNCQAMEKLLTDAGLFHNNGPPVLHNVFTGEVATQEMRADLLSFYSTGTRTYLAYVESRILRIPSASPPQRQHRLRTFAKASERKKAHSQKNKDNKLVTTCLKRRLAFSQTHGTTAKLANS